MTLRSKLLIALVSLTYLACGSAAAQQTADQAVLGVIDGLKENRLEVLWEALPPSFQSDVEGLRNDFVSRMDRELWNTNFRVLGKLVRILEEKRGFILSHPSVEPHLSRVGDFEATYSSAVAVLSAITTSELADLDRLQATNPGVFLAGSVSEVAVRLKAIAEQVPEASDSVDQLSVFGAELVSSDGDQAVVRIIDGKENKEVEFLRVEGKWLPAEMAKEWPDQISEVRGQFAAIPAERSEESRKYLTTLNSIEPLLDSVLAAQTADEFNASVQQLIGGVMGAWMMAG